MKPIKIKNGNEEFIIPKGFEHIIDETDYVDATPFFSSHKVLRITDGTDWDALLSIIKRDIETESHNRKIKAILCKQRPSPRCHDMRFQDDQWRANWIKLNDAMMNGGKILTKATTIGREVNPTTLETTLTITATFCTDAIDSLFKEQNES